MSIPKIAAGFAFSILSVLLLLTAVLENPEKELFTKTIESIMVEEELSSIQEVLDSFPDLKVIDAQIRQLTFLNNRIRSTTAGPAPNLSQEDNLQVQEYSHKARQLRSDIKTELSRINAARTKDQP